MQDHSRKMQRNMKTKQKGKTIKTFFDLRKNENSSTDHQNYSRNSLHRTILLLTFNY